MKDEKKLGEPFPPEGPARKGADECLSDFAGEAEDEDLSSLLKQWHAPGIPPSLDTRVAASFHQRVMAPPLWKCLLTARIPIPVPVAAVAILLFAVISFFALRSPQLGSFRQAEVVSAINQPKVLENPSARGSGVVRAPLPDVQIPSKATTSSSAGEPSKADGSQPPKTTQKMSTITLQGEQETIQCLAGTEYRPLAVPRIYAGIVFNPSEVR